MCEREEIVGLVGCKCILEYDVLVYVGSLYIYMGYWWVC